MTEKVMHSELATDLVLAFKLFNSDAMKLIEQAEKEEWTIQHLENELMRI